MKFKNLDKLFHYAGCEDRKDKVFIVMRKLNDGSYHFDANNHIRKTLLGIIKLINFSWAFRGGAEIKILEIDLSKANILYEGVYKD